MSKEKKHNEQSIGYYGLIVIAVLLTALILRVTNAVTQPRSLPLLTQADGLIKLTDISYIKTYTQTPISIPTKTFGSELRVIGIYTQDNGAFETGTIALVYEKNNWRFMEIDIKPNTTLDEQLTKYKTRQMEKLSLKENTDAYLIKLTGLIDCLKPNTKDTIGICQFTKMLIFEQNETVINIATDGNHVSDGELIEIGRTMK